MRSGSHSSRLGSHSARLACDQRSSARARCERGQPCRSAEPRAAHRGRQETRHPLRFPDEDFRTRIPHRHWVRVAGPCSRPGDRAGKRGFCCRAPWAGTDGDLASGREEREPAAAVREPVATIASPVAKNASRKGPPFASRSADDRKPLQVGGPGPRRDLGPQLGRLDQRKVGHGIASRRAPTMAPSRFPSSLIGGRSATAVPRDSKGPARATSRASRQ